VNKYSKLESVSYKNKNLQSPEFLASGTQGRTLSPGGANSAQVTFNGEMSGQSSRTAVSAKY